MDIRTLKLSDLNPAKYNPRKELKPGDTEFEKLKRSIESFGYVELIVVNETTGFTVISGHQRLSVLKALGYDSVECIVVSLDATREKALNIAMNKISGEWDTKKLENLLSDLKAEDFDVTLTGFDTSEIGLMLGVDDEIVQDEVPEIEADAPTICQPGELWQLGRHRLLCGSSTDRNDVALLMNGQHSKLLFTSPPYSDTRKMLCLCLAVALSQASASSRTVTVHICGNPLCRLVSLTVCSVSLYMFLSMLLPSRQVPTQSLSAISRTTGLRTVPAEPFAVQTSSTSPTFRPASTLSSVLTLRRYCLKASSCSSNTPKEVAI